jgi:hypothetical protein
MAVDLEDHGSAEMLNMFRLLRRAIVSLASSLSSLVIFSDTATRLRAFLPSKILDPSYEMIPRLTLIFYRHIFNFPILRV